MRHQLFPVVLAIALGCAAGSAPAIGQADASSPPVSDSGTGAGGGGPAPSDGGVTTADSGSGPTADAGPGPTADAGAASGGGSTWAGSGLLPSTAAGWAAFSARPPSAAVTSVSNGADSYVLDVEGGGLPNVYGGWTTTVAGLQGGGWYRFSARARPAAIASLRESVTVVLRWRGSFGEEVSPDYAWDFEKQADGTIVFDRTLQAPPGTTGLRVELILQWSAAGQVAFDRPTLTAVPAPPPRNVRVAAIYYRPDQTKSGLDSVQRAGNYAGQIATTYKPDVIVLGELLNVIGAPGPYDADAETIPGPSTSFISGIASAHRVNIAFGMVERSGDVLYNTAVLIDRNGTLVGKHRKVQLPLAEAAGGLSPGDSVEVFDTDVGRVALLICQETSFPEPAREAALQGAELLLVPIWGGKAALVHARAVENGVHVAASGYDYASEVVDPLGSVLASVVIGSGPKVAVADVDLARRYREDWLGDWRDIANKERRAGPYRYTVP